MRSTDHRSSFEAIAFAGSAIDQGKATTEQILLVARDVWLAYERWPELLASTNFTLQAEPNHTKALGLAAYACEQMDQNPEAQAFIDNALQQDPYQLHATLAKVNLLQKQEDRSAAIKVLHALYDKSSEERSYRYEMIFMELFIRYEDPDYVCRSSLSAYQQAEEDNCWTPKYRLAKYYWRNLQQLTQAENIIDEIKRSPAIFGKHPAVDLLHAELNFVTGDLKACGDLLETVRQATDLPDDPVEQLKLDTLTDAEMERFIQLSECYQVMEGHCPQP